MQDIQGLMLDGPVDTGLSPPSGDVTQGLDSEEVSFDQQLQSVLDEESGNLLPPETDDVPVDETLLLDRSLLGEQEAEPLAENASLLLAKPDEALLSEAVDADVELVDPLSPMEEVSSEEGSVLAGGENVSTSVRGGLGEIKDKPSASALKKMSSSSMANNDAVSALHLSDDDGGLVSPSSVSTPAPVLSSASDSAVASAVASVGVALSGAVGADQDEMIWDEFLEAGGELEDTPFEEMSLLGDGKSKSNNMLFDEGLSEEAEWLRLSEKLLAEKSARQGVMGSKSDARFAQVLADRSDLSRQSEPKVDSQIRFNGALSLTEHRVNAERNDMPPIPSTLRHVDWGKSLTQRVSLMVGQKLQSAEIQLNPRNLGPMEVQLSIQQDQASVIFSSQHAVVREAIEAALPKLREMLEEMGIQLDNVDVRQEYSEPNDAHKEPVFEKNRSSLQKEIEDSDSGVDKLRVGRTSTLEVNLVDYYA